MFRSLLILPALIAITPLLRAADVELQDARTVDYSHWSLGHAYGRTEATNDWPTLVWFDEPGAGSIAEYPAGSGRHWLRQSFPAGTFGGGPHGNKFAANLAPRDAYTVEYEVHFPADWEFSKNNTGKYGGGKLPGLSGGSHPSGGHGKPDGMSARPMWRRDSRFSAKAQSYLELYLYQPNQTEKYGDRFFAQAVEAGHTYRIKLRIELGTPDTDGCVRLWIDNTLRVTQPCRLLTPGQNWKLSQYMHNTFYGGNDPTWAPGHDTYLLLGPVRIDTKEF